MDEISKARMRKGYSALAPLPYEIKRIVGRESVFPCDLSSSEKAVFLRDIHFAYKYTYRNGHYSSFFRNLID